jgi:hypothetical protein
MDCMEFCVNFVARGTPHSWSANMVVHHAKYAPLTHVILVCHGCGPPTFGLPTLSRGARNFACATIELIVVAKYLTMRRGYIMVTHGNVGEPWLPYVWVRIFLIYIKNAISM